MSDTGKTLGELDVKVGDVVGVVRSGVKYTVSKDDDGKWCDIDKMVDISANVPIWHIVSRATPQPDYNDGKWHGWNGGECPVHPETKGKFVFADGSICMYKPAGEWCWSDSELPIIAFRVTKPYAEPREYWIAVDGGRVIDMVEEKPQDMYGCIHVREVTE